MRKQALRIHATVLQGQVWLSQVAASRRAFIRGRHKTAGQAADTGFSVKWLSSPHPGPVHPVPVSAGGEGNGVQVIVPQGDEAATFLQAKGRLHGSRRQAVNSGEL